VLSAIMIGCLVGAALLGLFHYYSRSSVGVTGATKPAVEPPLVPSAETAIPVLAEPSAKGAPPTPPREISATTPSTVVPATAPTEGSNPEHRAITQPPRQGRAVRPKDNRQIQHVRRNRNGIPLLEP
jgi:hypothetical protein